MEHPNVHQRIAILARRAQRLRRDGQHRKAANAYGELTSADEFSGRWWVLLARALWDCRKEDEAIKALRQAIYLFRQENALGRAKTVQDLISRWTSGTLLRTRRGYLNREVA